MLIAQPGEGVLIGLVTIGLIQHVAVPEQAVVFKLAQNSIRGAGDFARGIDIFNSHPPQTLQGAGL